MPIDGYAPQEITFWWVAIGVGFVVVLVVVLLLSALVWLVKIADGVDLVLAEGLKHHLFLGRVLSGAGTPTGGAGS